MSEWADVDHWKAMRQQPTPEVRGTFAMLEASPPRTQGDRRDRRFVALGTWVVCTERRNAGMRSRGWRQSGRAVPRHWLEEHAGETWEGVAISEILVALDAWLEAGSPAAHASRLRRLTPVVRK